MIASALGASFLSSSDRHRPVALLGLASRRRRLAAWALASWQSAGPRSFTAAFPDAIDIIVRGIKAGLPVHDCLKLIAGEAREPLRRSSAAWSRTSHRHAVGELEQDLRAHAPAGGDFFTIVMSIQQDRRQPRRGPRQPLERCCARAS